jgi:hypothetical protein
MPKILEISKTEAVALLAECGGNLSEASRKSGVSRQTLRRYAQALNFPSPSSTGPGQLHIEFGQDSGVVKSKSARITTVARVLAMAEVDLKVWMVDRCVINKWEVGARDDEGKIVVEPLVQVKVWLKRRILDPMVEALREITAELKGGVLKRRPLVYVRPADAHLLEISLVDHHWGKLAWDKEVGEDYDVKIAEQRYVTAIVSLLRKARAFPISKILFPIGSDFFHINNAENTTVHGTKQDVDSRLQRIVKTAADSVVWSLEECRKVAPVDVIYVPGNHDKLTSWFFCKILEAWFRGCDEVNIDASETARKYFRFGVNLLGFTHGDEEPHQALPTIMASERKKDWAECRQFEWHIGHFHKRKETRFLAGDTLGNVGVRILPSLSGTDAWHYGKGYVQGQKAAEAYLWSEEDGFAAMFSSNVAA